MTLKFIWSNLKTENIFISSCIRDLKYRFLYKIDINLYKIVFCLICILLCSFDDVGVSMMYSFSLRD